VPPQQGNGLLDLFDGVFGLGAHAVDIGMAQPSVKIRGGPASQVQ
jgi:hypothetical protein